ncbi:DUF3574 domain-containing protein [Acetobacter musti]|nr:DUF3574 domain-containing protein [Acetobacter musti]
MSMTRRIALTAFALLVTGCQAPDGGTRPAMREATQATAQPVAGESVPRLCGALGATSDLQITLMFGMTRPEGGVVTDADWRGFLRDVITPRFPAGLTVQNGLGQWQDRETGRIGTEPSRLVWVVTEETPDLGNKITAIRDAYKKTFHQQAVGLTVTRGCSSF